METTRLQKKFAIIWAQEFLCLLSQPCLFCLILIRPHGILSSSKAPPHTYICHLNLITQLTLMLYAHGILNMTAELMNTAIVVKSCVSIWQLTFRD